MRHKQLGIAVVGSGRIGTLRAGMVATHPAVNFLAISDQDPTRAAALSKSVEADFSSGDNLEVIARDEAEKVYQDERDAGNDAGLATKNSYQDYQFRIARVPANAETRMRFVYYQPLEIDTGVGRYLYPLEDGGTDEIAKSFWLPNEKVEGTLSIALQLESAWPVTDVRVPGFEGQAKVEQQGEGRYRVSLERQGASLDRDFVVYYRLEELP